MHITNTNTAPPPVALSPSNIVIARSATRGEAISLGHRDPA